MIINVLLVGLFMVSILSFAFGLASNYGKEQNIMGTEYVDFGRIEENLNETSEIAKSWGESFKSDNIFTSAGSILLLSVWGIAKLMWTTIMTFFTIYFDIAESLFGVPPLVTGIISAIIIIGLIFSLWRSIKQG